MRASREPIFAWLSYFLICSVFITFRDDRLKQTNTRAAFTFSKLWVVLYARAMISVFFLIRLSKHRQQSASSWRRSANVLVQGTGSRNTFSFEIALCHQTEPPLLPSTFLNTSSRSLRLRKILELSATDSERGKRNERQKGHIGSVANLHPLQSSIHADRQMSSSQIH